MPVYDIHFQPVPAEDVRRMKAFTFGFTASLMVKGMQSLVNRWMKTFMTPLGSDPGHPQEGTQLSSLLGQNVDLTGSNVQDLAIISVEEANAQVRQQDLDGLFPDDESLANATLQKWQLSYAGDGIEMWVDVQNKAGTILRVPLVLLATR